ncbi:MAG: hypothetical protein RH982_16920 [Parvibaculum sp.]
MISQQDWKTTADRKGWTKIAAALVAFSAAGTLTAGEAAAAPFCSEGYVALEAGARAGTGDLTLSGNYGGAPETGGGSFGQGIVGFDVGVRVQMGGGTVNVNPPPAILPPSMIPPENRADQLRRVELVNSGRALESEYLLRRQQKGADDPETKELHRRLQVVQNQLAEMDRRRNEEIDKIARRHQAEDAKAEKAESARHAPCEGPVIGARGRLPVGDRETSRHNIHPLPSVPTSVFYDATWILTAYVGYMMLVDAYCLSEEPVTVTPWAGVSVERGKLGMTTDELGTVSSFSEDVTRAGPSIGVNVDVPLNDNMFAGFGLQGDFLSGASATGTSPLFTYNYGRDNSFEYSGFARLGIRW